MGNHLHKSYSLCYCSINYHLASQLPIGNLEKKLLLTYSWCLADDQSSQIPWTADNVGWEAWLGWVEGQRISWLSCLAAPSVVTNTVVLALMLGNRKRRGWTWLLLTSTEIRKKVNFTWFLWRVLSELTARRCDKVIWRRDRFAPNHIHSLKYYSPFLNVNIAFQIHPFFGNKKVNNQWDFTYAFSMNHLDRQLPIDVDVRVRRHLQLPCSDRVCEPVLPRPLSQLDGDFHRQWRLEYPVVDGCYLAHLN